MYQPLYRPASDGAQRTDILVTQQPGLLLFDLWMYSPRPQKVTVKVINRKGDIYLGLNLKNFKGSMGRVLDLTELPEGIYILQIVFEGKTYYKRLVVPAKSLTA